MIFVAVGTQKFPMNRLLKNIDGLIAAGRITEEVFAQKGHSDYCPEHYVCADFLSKEEFEKMVEKCDLLITHSGVGTIISGVSRRKSVIVYPRLCKYGEHVDDHQLEIARSFSEQNLVLLCKEEDSLMEIIEAAKQKEFAVYRSQRETVLATLREYFNTI